MWMINGQVVNRQRNFTDGNGNRQRGVILVRWSKEALAEIGVVPFREDRYDKDIFVSTGYTDAAIDGEMVRTHTTEDRYTIPELAARAVERERLEKIALYRAAFTDDDFMEAYFEKEFESRPEKMDALQALRVNVKAEFTAIPLKE